MKRTETYDKVIKDEHGEYKSYFYGIINHNEDGSKDFFGFYQDGTSLMAMCSDVGVDMNQTFRILDYGDILSTKLRMLFSSWEDYYNGLTDLIQKCASSDKETAKNILSNIGNVEPEWSIEKFNDPVEVFTRLKNGESLREIVGPGKNYYHNYRAYEQTPSFEKPNKTR